MTLVCARPHGGKGRNPPPANLRAGGEPWCADRLLCRRHNAQRSPCIPHHVTGPMQALLQKSWTAGVCWEASKTQILCLCASNGSNFVYLGSYLCVSDATGQSFSSAEDAMGENHV